MIRNIKYGWQLSMQSLYFVIHHPSILLAELVGRGLYVLALLVFIQPIIASIKHVKSEFLSNFAGAFLAHYTVVELLIAFLLILFLLNILNSLIHAAIKLSVMHQLQHDSFNFWHQLVFVLKRLPKMIWWCFLRSCVGNPSHALRWYWREKGWFKRYLVNGNFRTSNLIIYYYLLRKDMPAFKAWRAACAGIRERWGETIIFHFNIGFKAIFAVVELVVYVPIIYWLYTASTAGQFFDGAVAMFAAHQVLSALSLMLIDTMHGAMFHYLETGEGERPFTTTALREAFRPDVRVDL